MKHQSSIGHTSSRDTSPEVRTTVAERAQRAATSETHANRKTPTNQVNIFIILTADGENAHTHKQIHFICSAFLFWLCCEHLQRVC